jgi:hypothetical protein
MPPKIKEDSSAETEMDIDAENPPAAAFPVVVLNQSLMAKTDEESPASSAQPPMAEDTVLPGSPSITD